MFGFGKKRAAVSDDVIPTEPPATEKSHGLLGRLKQGLKKTGEILNSDVRDLVKLKREIDDELIEELETQLLSADLGIEATAEIIDTLSQQVSRKELKDGEALFSAMKQSMKQQLQRVEAPLVIDTHKRPYVILVVGVNGAGKTTTIGKLAKHLQQQGKRVLLAAGDTFRAAAVEQLQIWGERNDIEVVAQKGGADSASVIFDAISAGRAREVDVVIADTAGRLHTQSGLMDELTKVRRVSGKLDATAPHEVLLVLDAGIGQNGVKQAEQFDRAVGVTGIVLTKLDGTAKGGVIFAIANKLRIPIRFIGVGEQIDDLRPFNAADFIAALFDES
ncbi:signal recognition particle-docking protein FtsY [Ectothiorhodospiraceae bacterium BW-2]|nr:signal recognition particle-docking protein FtsY [Ectothiorhodospiraceae bacterium BW-2]